MSREQQQRGEGGAAPATEMQLALMQEGTREVVEVWETPITEERKNWTKQYLEKKLREKHDVKLTQGAAEALVTMDRKMERMVKDNGLKMYCYVDGRDHGVELNNTHWSGGIREFAI